MTQNKAKVILFVSQKGGCGKTTNLINLATASMFQGTRNVVILDCDPQRSATLWQDDNRDDKVKAFEYVLPQVVAPKQDVMPSQIVNRLLDQMDEIWIDTAGFVGYSQDTAQMYLNDILPLVDLIVTPFKASKFDLNATKDTLEYINHFSRNINLNIPKLLLLSDIKGGEKGTNYALALLEPILSLPSNSEWTVMKTYIPYSGLFVKAHERGGNAFVPRKIERVTEAYVSALLEIREQLGLISESQKRDVVEDIISSLQSTRQNASKEKRQDELDDQE
ncbi:ParA family protein (plasmid) [Acinetobacter sp. SK-43]|uniref:ParA family protein n=1 Tax=Pseudomonadota TaxID=1224 RepID=UPI0012CD29CB|nr:MULTISPECIES: ParA family protein [Pseudomonadota]MBF4453811.1 ParA family protein [Acinetobacter sp. SK-43]MPS92749.1 ParA family protein [Comamonas sp.]